MWASGFSSMIYLLVLVWKFLFPHISVMGHSVSLKLLFTLTSNCQFEQLLKVKNKSDAKFLKSSFSPVCTRWSGVWSPFSALGWNTHWNDSSNSGPPGESLTAMVESCAHFDWVKQQPNIICKNGFSERAKFIDPNWILQGGSYLQLL